MFLCFTLQAQIPQWANDAVIYEVNIRQYTPEGTFNAFSEHLPRLQEMGVEIIWLMPIHPIGEEKRKGSLGSYYSVKDYKGINPEFGNLSDFKNLVNKAHALEMKVIIDWVANHTAWNHPWTKEHPEWYTKGPDWNFVPPVADWSDVIDLNYDRKPLWSEMIESMKYWLVEADIDGFRCDVAEMVPTYFWEKAKVELDKVKPVFMLAEAENPEHHEAAFNMSYGWEFHHIMNDIAKGEKNAAAVTDYFARKFQRFGADNLQMFFVTNHDENSWNGSEFERMGDGVQAFAALTFCLPNMPLIYSGQEAAMTKRLAFFEKDSIDWAGYPMQDFYARLVNMKKENTPLYNGEFGGDLEFLDVGNKNICAFIRTLDREKVLCIFNFSNEEQKFKMNFEYLPKQFVNVYMPNDKGKYKLKSLKKLAAWRFYILKGVEK